MNSKKRKKLRERVAKQKLVKQNSGVVTTTRTYHDFGPLQNLLDGVAYYAFREKKIPEYSEIVFRKVSGKSVREYPPDKGMIHVLILWDFLRTEIQQHSARKVLWQAVLDAGDGFGEWSEDAKLVARLELLPDAIFRKILWVYNIDFMSTASFFRRLTTEQREAINLNYQDYIAEKVPRAFKKGFSGTLRCFFGLTSFEKLKSGEHFGAERYRIRAALSWEFPGLGCGFALWPHGPENDISNPGKLRFLARKKVKAINKSKASDPGSFSGQGSGPQFGIDPEGGYAWMYRTLRSNFLWGKNRTPSLEGWLCLKFWSTLLFNFLFWIASPVSIGVYAVLFFGVGISFPDLKVIMLSGGLPATLVAGIMPMWVGFALLKLVFRGITFLWRGCVRVVIKPVWGVIIPFLRKYNLFRVLFSFLAVVWFMFTRHVAKPVDVKMTQIVGRKKWIIYLLGCSVVFCLLGILVPWALYKLLIYWSQTLDLGWIMPMSLVASMFFWVSLGIYFTVYPDAEDRKFLKDGIRQIPWWIRWGTSVVIVGDCVWVVVKLFGKALSKFFSKFFGDIADLATHLSTANLFVLFCLLVLIVLCMRIAMRTKNDFSGASAVMGTVFGCIMATAIFFFQVPVGDWIVDRFASTAEHEPIAQNIIPISTTPYDDESPKASRHPTTVGSSTATADVPSIASESITTSPAHGTPVIHKEGSVKSFSGAPNDVRLKVDEPNKGLTTTHIVILVSVFSLLAVVVFFARRIYRYSRSLKEGYCPKIEKTGYV